MYSGYTLHFHRDSKPIYHLKCQLAIKLKAIANLQAKMSVVKSDGVAEVPDDNRDEKRMVAIAGSLY